METETLEVRIRNAERKMVPVGDLRPHPKNPRMGDVGAVSESIKAHGFYGGLIVQKSTGHIVAGNHRYKAAVHLGYTELPVDYIDCTDEEAVRILIADNRSSDLATNDQAMLLELLEGMAKTDLSLLGTLYSLDDLDDLIFEAQNPFGSVRADGVSNAERTIGYQAAGIRSLVFPFRVEDYERVVLMMETVRKERGLDSHSAVLMTLLEGACES